MAAVHAEDVRASFLFVGDLNAHHREWLCSTTAIRHGYGSQLSQVAISWLLAQPMHVVEHLSSWWLMFLTKYGLLM